MCSCRSEAYRVPLSLHPPLRSSVSPSVFFFLKFLLSILVFRDTPVFTSGPSSGLPLFLLPSAHLCGVLTLAVVRALQSGNAKREVETRNANSHFRFSLAVHFTSALVFLSRISVVSRFLRLVCTHRLFVYNFY